MKQLTYTRYNTEEAQPLVEQLIETYLDVYKDADPNFFNETRYRQQLTSHMTAPLWELITATIDSVLVGYIYGFALRENSRWGEGLQTSLSDNQLHETGDRTVAVSEILVTEPHRRKHIAETLHTDFMERRTEKRATLLVEPDNIPAVTAYEKWGYEPIGLLTPGWDNAPTYQAHLLTLTA